jgi:hypothetical protein
VSLVLFYSSRKAQANRAVLAVGFVAITNDVSGRVAIFSLSNRGDSSIEVGLPPETEVRNKEYNNPGRVVIPTLLSPSSQPLIVRVIAPQTQDPWRVGFSYYPVDSRDRLGRFAALFGLRLGGRAVVASTTHSQWIGPNGPMAKAH